MRGIVKAVFVVAWSLGMSSCADQRTIAGGTGTGTDNVVTARSLSLSVDSLLDSSQVNTASSIPLLLRLDSTNFRFEDARDDGADLRPSLPDGYPLPFVLRDWSKAARRASLWVRLDGFRRGSGARVVLSWGDPSVVAASDPVAMWRGVPDSVRLARASLPVADFESGTGSLLLPCRCNTFYAGEKEAGALILPVPHKRIDSAIVNAGAGRSGKALHVVYAATGPTNYGLVGTGLGTSTNRLAGLDSIVLWLRGTGSLRVALENSKDTTSLSKAWLTIVPDTSWRRFAIRPTDFNAPSAGARGWNAIKDSVNTLTFFFYDGGEMWIDDIRFHGLAKSDIP